MYILAVLTLEFWTSVFVAALTIRVTDDLRGTEELLGFLIVGASPSLLGDVCTVLICC